jgi:hypothetical protein
VEFGDLLVRSKETDAIASLLRAMMVLSGRVWGLCQRPADREHEDADADADADASQAAPQQAFERVSFRKERPEFSG